MVTHLAFNIKNGEKQKTLALNNKERGKAKSTQKKQKHTYLIDGRTYISNRRKFPPVFYRTSALWGRCPALTPLLHWITQQGIGYR